VDIKALFFEVVLESDILVLNTILVQTGDEEERNDAAEGREG
jgi:hypothetical protein